MSALALLGGKPVCDFASRESWEPDCERELELCERIIRERAFSDTGHPIARQFEALFREKVAGTKYVLAHNNGTSTLLAAYFAVGVGPGDEIITPTYNWICSFAPATLLGARPVFCDIDPETLCLDPADLPDRLTERTRAIVVPHLFGAVCDMDRIMAFAREHDLAVIEDCSHSHGATWDGRLIGSIGDVGCFSMQGGSPGGKPVAAGEGGVIATSDRHLYERILAMGHLNRKGMADELTEEPLNRLGSSGWAMVKFRISNLSLCIATVALEQLDYRNRRVQENYDRLLSLIADVPCLRPIKQYPKARNAGYYGHMRIIFDPEPVGGLTPERFQEACQAEGASLAGRNYDGYHITPPYDTGMAYYDDGRGAISPARGYTPQPPGSLPNAEAVIPNILSIPTMIEPPDGYIEAFAAAIHKVYEHHEELL
ncbi:MAG: DegT/DnrJ/EryC1/StrS family aminotransferase [Armatimonadetes bacterium]|nr:DegT/DnrJ/EryC1/StrS family aminotransferase [Armatimonadota bacterium]